MAHFEKNEFYYDTRKGKTFQILTIGETVVQIQYFDFVTKEPSQEPEVIAINFLESYIDQEAYQKWMQDFIS